jgi:kynurenine formamidase
MKPLLLLLAFFVVVSTNAADWTRADFQTAFTNISNWGRWGAEDQRGAFNLITPAKRKEALALVREGFTVSLARDLDKIRSADNGSPFVHSMDRSGFNNTGYSCADTYMFTYHGMAHTHMDSLCHFFHDGKMYNGFAQTNVTSQGAERLSIHNFKNGIISRGILVDIPVLKNIQYLEPGTGIYPEDLDAWEKKAGLKIRAGDIVLIRTGRWARRAETGPWNTGKYAGLHASCAKWLKDRDIAMLGSDAASDMLPSSVEGVTMPIHELTLIAMGACILDNCDLEPLSAAAKERNRWEFLLTVCPLAVPGGTGSPVNPIATF